MPEVGWGPCDVTCCAESDGEMYFVINLYFLLLFSDVLCPSVRVEGHGFKYTSGGTKEITGERNGRATRLCCAALCCAVLRCVLDPTGTLLESGGGGLAVLFSFLPFPRVLVEWFEPCRWQLPHPNRPAGKPIPIPPGAGGDAVESVRGPSGGGWGERKRVTDSVDNRVNRPLCLGVKERGSQSY